MTNEISQNVLPSAIERALIGGDLQGLKTEDRIIYYNHLCNSLGLNPLTKPFNYIVLNGKLTLYATKDCTDQLRTIRGVSITDLESKIDGDLCIVTAKGKDKTGRTDASTGAVDLKGLSGEKKANALMKAETKAKRRLTLSLCGMGMVDESEVASIEGAKIVDEKYSALAGVPAKSMTEIVNPTFEERARAMVNDAKASKPAEEIEFAVGEPEIKAEEKSAPLPTGEGMDEYIEALGVAQSADSVKAIWKQWRSKASATELNAGYTLYKDALKKHGGS